MDINTGNIGYVPVILGLVQVLKEIGLPSKYAPLASIIFGIGISYFSGQAISPEMIFNGIVIGLSASGLWSGSKTVSKEVFGATKDKIPQTPRVVSTKEEAEPKNGSNHASLNNNEFDTTHGHDDGAE